MSRTKGSNAQSGPPHWRHGPEQDVSAYPQRGQGRQPGPTGHPQRDPYAGHQAQTQPRPQPQPHFPQEAFRNLGAERHAAALSRPSYPPHFERSPTPGPSLNDRLSQHAAEMQPRNDGYGRHSDPSGYDLAHYAPDQHPNARPDHMHDPYAPQGPYDAAAAEGWNNPAYGQQQAYADEPMDGSYPGQLGYGVHPEGGLDDQDYGEEEPEAPRRRSRTYMVAGVLVCAMVVGGGLTYGYKSLTGRGDGKTPVVRADSGPAKSKPKDAGGKDIAHTDKKFINRLGDDKSAGSDADADTGAPRKVTTLTVNRDGSVAAPNSIASASQLSGSSNLGGSGVPGMLLDNLNSGPARAQMRGSSAGEAQALGQQPQGSVQQGSSQATNQAAVPQRPQVIAKAQATPEPTPRQAKKASEREDAGEASTTGKVATASAAPQATGGNGYVPVLASQKSRMDALKAFADMQQKYGEALQNGTPDVREVDLGDKGVWHRLMLGPPGSRETAKTVCNQLKAQGYSGCWVTAY